MKSITLSCSTYKNLSRPLAFSWEQLCMVPRNLESVRHMTFIARQGFKLVRSLIPFPCLADVLKIIPKDPHTRTLIQIPQLLLTTTFSTYNKAEGFVFLQMLISVFSAGLSLESH